MLNQKVDSFYNFSHDKNNQIMTDKLLFYHLTKGILSNNNTLILILVIKQESGNV